MAHGAVLTPDLGHVPAVGRHDGRRRRHLLRRLAAVVAALTVPTAERSSVALTDDEMLAESAGWW